MAAVASFLIWSSWAGGGLLRRGGIWLGPWRRLGLATGACLLVRLGPLHRASLPLRIRMVILDIVRLSDEITHLLRSGARLLGGVGHGAGALAETRQLPLVLLLQIVGVLEEHRVEGELEGRR